MEWIHFLSIMTALLGGFGFIYREFKAIEKDLREDMRLQSNRIDKQNERTDKLYEMFYELLKENKGLK